MLTSREAKIIAAMQNRHQRRKQPFYFAEGLRVCDEALQRIPRDVELILATEDFMTSSEATDFLNTARNAKRRIEVTNTKTFSELADTPSPQGVLCLLKKPDFQAPTTLPKPFVLILDRVSEPGNFGTILRTAWAVGLKHIWLIKGGADPYAPKVVRSGMGAQFVLNFSQFDSLAEARDTLFELGGKILWCTEEKADVTVFDEQHFQLENAGLVMGNEANGISDTSLGTPVTIPMPGNAESLNVAQATTVFLFEAVRRNILQ